MTNGQAVPFPHSLSLFFSIPHTRPHPKVGKVEQEIVTYVLTIMNAVQLLFKQSSLGREVLISVVLMDVLKTQPLVSLLSVSACLSFGVPFVMMTGSDGIRQH